MFILSLICLNRIPVTTGSAVLLDMFKTKENLKAALSQKEYSVIVFEDANYVLSFMDFGIYKYGSNVTFGLAPAELGPEYNCTSFPCFAAFKGQEHIESSFPRPFPIEFALWCKRFMQNNKLRVTSSEEIREAFSRGKEAILAVDYQEDEILPVDVSNISLIYYTSRTILKRFLQIDIEKGLYLFRPTDRCLVKIEKSLEETRKSPFVIPEPGTIEGKDYFAGFVVSNEKATIEKSTKCYNTLLKLKEKYDSKVSFSLIYGKYQSFFNKFGKLNGIDSPYFVVFNSSNIGNKRWFIKEHDLNDYQHYENFLGNIIAGKEPFTLKSKALPDQAENETFKELVAINAESIINYNNRTNIDTLIVVTASWCGHCAHFKPIIKETANLLIGKPYRFYWIDGIENELSMLPKVEGFPTMFLYPVGKTEPIEFDGDRTVEGLKKFIQESATNKLYNETEVNASSTNSTKLNE